MLNLERLESRDSPCGCTPMWTAVPPALVRLPPSHVSPPSPPSAAHCTPAPCVPVCHPTPPVPPPCNHIVTGVCLPAISVGVLVSVHVTF